MGSGIKKVSFCVCTCLSLRAPGLAAEPVFPTLSDLGPRCSILVQFSCSTPRVSLGIVHRDLG